MCPPPANYVSGKQHKQVDAEQADGNIVSCWYYGFGVNVLDKAFACCVIDPSSPVVRLKGYCDTNSLAI